MRIQKLRPKEAGTEHENTEKNSYLLVVRCTFVLHLEFIGDFEDA
jgi:hypothetical protein